MRWETRGFNSEKVRLPQCLIFSTNPRISEERLM